MKTSTVSSATNFFHPHNIAKEEYPHEQELTKAWFSTLHTNKDPINSFSAYEELLPCFLNGSGRESSSVFQTGTETVNLDEYGYIRFSEPPALPLPLPCEEQSRVKVASNLDSWASESLSSLMGHVALEPLQKVIEPSGSFLTADVSESEGYHCHIRDVDNPGFCAFPQGLNAADNNTTIDKTPKVQGITMEQVLLAQEWIEGKSSKAFMPPLSTYLIEDCDGRADGKDKRSEYEELMQTMPGERRRLRVVAVSTEPQSIAARQRRMKISDRTWKLGQLIPGSIKMDTASMLDSAMNYVRFLEAQQACLQNESNIVDSNLKERVLLNRLILSPQIQHHLSESGLCLVTTRQASMLNFDPRSVTLPSTPKTNPKPQF